MRKDLAHSSANLQAVAGFLRVLAEPRRLLILELLMKGERCNCEMGDALDMAPNLMSHHLSVLREAGLVNARRDEHDARWIYYSINCDVLKEVNEALIAFLDPRRIQSRFPNCESQCGPKCEIHVSQVER